MQRKNFVSAAALEKFSGYCSIPVTVEAHFISLHTSRIGKQLLWDRMKSVYQPLPDGVVVVAADDTSENGVGTVQANHTFPTP